MSLSCAFTTSLTLAASAYDIFGIFGLTAKQPLLSTLNELNEPYQETCNVLALFALLYARYSASLLLSLSLLSVGTLALLIVCRSKKIVYSASLNANLHSTFICGHSNRY
jgi:hypothetical protein